MIFPLSKKAGHPRELTNWTAGPVYRYKENFKPLYFYFITTILGIIQTLFLTIRVKYRHPAFIFAF